MTLWSLQSNIIKHSADTYKMQEVLHVKGPNMLASGHVSLSQSTAELVLYSSEIHFCSQLLPQGLLHLHTFGNEVSCKCPILHI